MHFGNLYPIVYIARARAVFCTFCPSLTVPLLKELSSRDYRARGPRVLYSVVEVDYVDIGYMLLCCILYIYKETRTKATAKCKAETQT